MRRLGVVSGDNRAGPAYRPACQGGIVPKRTGLTAAAVARAALALLDSEGLEAVTMRRVAAQLNVSPMTLYPYVGDREGLLDDVTQLVYAEMAAPDEPADPDEPAGPRETLRALMRDVRRVLLAHPHALPLVSRHPPRTPEALAFLEAGYRTLRRAGVPAIDVARCYRALAAYSIGTATVEITHYFDGARAPGHGPASDPDTLARTHPHVAEVAPLVSGLDDADEFDYGLDLTLDGFLARHLPG
jgi:AcrR family transcriptional regulator